MQRTASLVSALLTPFLAFPPTAPVVIPVQTAVRRLQTFLGHAAKFFKAKNLIDAGQRVYLQIPGDLDRIVRISFSEASSPAFPARRSPARSLIPAAGVAATSRTAFLSTGSEFQASLDQAMQFVTNDRFQELVDHVPALLASDAAFEAELRAAIGPALGALFPTIDQDPSSRPAFESVLDSTLASVTARMLLYFDILSYVSEATQIDSFEDPDYLERKAELLAEFVTVRDTVEALHSATEAVNEAAAEAGTGVATAVITAAVARSGGVEITSIPPGPESFEVVAEIENVSDQSIAGLEAEMPSLDEVLGVSFQSPQRISLPTLGPGQSTQVNWELTCDPTEQPAALPLTVMLEVVPEDAAFIPGFFQLLLPIVEVADADEDGLPDSYETEFGLGVNQVSSQEDKDGDGLLNYSEYLIETRPDDPDTDDDGVSDGDEVEAGSDPLDPDSTPDSDARETGDVNKDGAINIQDVIFLLRYLSGEGLAPFPLSLGDVNGDDHVDIEDVTLLLNQTVQGQ